MCSPWDFPFSYGVQIAAEEKKTGSLRRPPYGTGVEHWRTGVFLFSLTRPWPGKMAAVQFCTVWYHTIKSRKHGTWVPRSSFGVQEDMTIIRSSASLDFIALGNCAGGINIHEWRQAKRYVVMINIKIFTACVVLPASSSERGWGMQFVCSGVLWSPFLAVVCECMK